VVELTADTGGFVLQYLLVVFDLIVRWWRTIYVLRGLPHLQKQCGEPFWF
jgi:hypothetical protein